MFVDARKQAKLIGSGSSEGGSGEEQQQGILLGPHEEEFLAGDDITAVGEEAEGERELNIDSDGGTNEGGNSGSNTRNYRWYHAWDRRWNPSW